MVLVTPSATPAALAQWRPDLIAPGTPSAAPAALAQVAALVAAIDASCAAPRANTPGMAAPPAVTSAPDTSSVVAASAVTDAAPPNNNEEEAALPASTRMSPDAVEEDDIESPGESRDSAMGSSDISLCEACLECARLKEWGLPLCYQCMNFGK